MLAGQVDRDVGDAGRSSHGIVADGCSEQQGCSDPVEGAFADFLGVRVSAGRHPPESGRHLPDLRGRRRPQTVTRSADASITMYTNHAKLAPFAVSPG